MHLMLLDGRKEAGPKQHHLLLKTNVYLHFKQIVIKSFYYGLWIINVNMFETNWLKFRNWGDKWVIIF